MLAFLFITFFTLILLDTPMFLCLMIPSTIYLLLQDHYPLTFIVQRMVDAADSFPMMAIPFFILAANIMNGAGITFRLFRFAKAITGHIPGGIAHVNVVASIFFAGITGAAVAEAGGLGKIELEAMKKEGYDVEFSAGLAAAAATIGPIIPPSIPLVIYGMVAEVSVGALFIGGIIPGLLMGLSLMVMIYFFAKRRNYPKEKREPFLQMIRAFIIAFPALMTPVIIIGGILSGVFSPTEAAVVAVVYSAILGAATTREFSFKQYFSLLIDSVENTAILMLIISAAVLFGTLLAHENINMYLVMLLDPFTGSKWVFLLFLNILFLFIGCIIEPIISLLVFLPMLLPIAAKVGVDPIHLGLVAVLNLMIGLLTPPVGMLLYVMTNIAGIPFERVARGTAPFIIPLVIVLFLITYIPSLVTFLPNLFLGTK